MATEAHHRRADARQNREKLLRVAAELFAERGLEVSLNEVAREAGVGIATLQRNFDSRADLVATVFARRVAEYADAAEAALAQEDPWAGFAGFVERAAAMQLADRGFAVVLTTDFPDARELQGPRRRALRAFTAVVKRAQAAGVLRSDFSVHDLPLFLLANAGVIAGTGTTAERASARVVGYLLAACRTGITDPLPPPPSPRALLAAL